MNEREREAIKRLREYIAEATSDAEHDDDDYANSHNWSLAGAALDALLAECEQAKRDAITMFRDASGLARYEEARLARARCIQYQRDMQAAHDKERS